MPDFEGQPGISGGNSAVMEAPRVEAPPPPPLAETDNPLAKMDYTPPEGAFEGVEAMTQDPEPVVENALPEMPPITEGASSVAETNLFAQPVAVEEPVATETAMKQEQEGEVVPPPVIAEVSPADAATENTSAERIQVLEQQLTALQAKLEAMQANASEKTITPMRRLGQIIGSKLGALEQRFRAFMNIENNSPIYKKVTEFTDRCEKSIEALSNVWTVKESAATGFTIVDGQFIRTESTEAKAPEAVAPESLEEPLQTEKAAEEPSAQVEEMAEMLNSPEAATAEVPEQASEQEVAKAAFEAATESPQAMELISKLDEFAQKYGLDTEFIQGALASRFGKAAEILLNIYRDPEGRAFIMDLAKLALSSEVISREVGLRFGPGSWSAERAAGTQPSVESQGSRPPLSESEKAEKRRTEMRELIRTQEGRFESNLSAAVQASSYRREAFRLSEKAALQPPGNVLDPTYAYEERVGKPGGGEDVYRHVFDYHGDLESPEALNAAMSDQNLKAEVTQTLAESPDLSVFQEKMKAMFGDAVQFRLPLQENGQPVEQYQPPKDRLIASYEEGRLVIQIQKLEDAGPFVGTSQRVDSTFNFKKREQSGG